MKRQKLLWSYFRLAVLVPAFFLLAGGLAQAQIMPAPQKSPRTPVGRQALSDTDKAAIRSRDIKGSATIIDGEHLRVGDVDLRLFGVVPPQLSASFGPQARSALDEVTRGQDVECHIRDRDHDGRFLATCATANTKIDLALELLKRGLAVAARGSVQPTDLAVPYETAEQAAEAQKLGLWSTAIPQAATVQATPPSVAKNESSNVPPLPSEVKKEEKTPALPATTMPPAATSALSSPTAAAPKALPSLPPPVIISAPIAEEGAGAPGFFARYQLLITSLVIVATALGIMGVLAFERRRDRRDEMKAIAAALRGELLAARAVCQARLRSWAEADEKSASWPRIRATLYQAYVGKIGWLGAVLARQIASIYGQAADYAAYFNPSPGSGEPREAVSRQYAVQALIQHIDEVLPKLAAVEQTGCRPKNYPMPKQTSATPPHHGSASGGMDTAAYAASIHAVAAPLWGLVKKFTRAGRQDGKPIMDESIPDYTALIEEEMARMSAEEEIGAAPANITKMRGSGG